MKHFTAEIFNNFLSLLNLITPLAFLNQKNSLDSNLKK